MVSSVGSVPGLPSPAGGKPGVSPDLVREPGYRDRQRGRTTVAPSRAIVGNSIPRHFPGLQNRPRGPHDGFFGWKTAGRRIGRQPKAGSSMRHPVHRRSALIALFGPIPGHPAVDAVRRSLCSRLVGPWGTCNRWPVQTARSPAQGPFARRVPCGLARTIRQGIGRGISRCSCPSDKVNKGSQAPPPATGEFFRGLSLPSREVTAPALSAGT